MSKQAGLIGTQMDPNNPPNAIGAAQTAPEIANSRTPGLLGHLGHFGQNFHFGRFGQPFPNQGGHAEKKFHLQLYGLACINETELHLNSVEIRPTGSQAKFSTGGAFATPSHPPRPTYDDPPAAQQHPQTAMPASPCFRASQTAVFVSHWFWII